MKIIIDEWSNQIEFRLVRSQKATGYQNFNDEAFLTIFEFIITFNMGGSFSLSQYQKLEDEYTSIGDYENIADIFKDVLENGVTWT